MLTFLSCGPITDNNTPSRAKPLLFCARRRANHAREEKRRKKKKTNREVAKTPSKLKPNRNAIMSDRDTPDEPGTPSVFAGVNTRAIGRRFFDLTLRRDGKKKGGQNHLQRR
jgi:hypothetical protein